MGAARIIQPAAPHIWVPRIVTANSFTRRPGARHNRGRVGGRTAAISPPSLTPPTIVSSVPCQAYYEVDALNVTTVGSAVSLWQDLSGNGRHLQQGTAAARPTFNAADVNFGGRASITFNGVAHILVCAAFALPAAGTTPCFIWHVCSQQSWVNGRNISAGATPASHHLFQNTPSPNISIYNGVIANNTLWALNSPARIETHFSNSVADFLKVGSTTTTGTSAGNTAPCTQFCVGGTGASVAAATYVACGVWFGVPTPAERADLDAYVTARWGAAV
jgi:hypothetical protein